MGKTKYFVSHIPLKRFNNLIFRLRYKVNFRPGCQLGLWCQKGNIFALITMGYSSKYSKNKGVGLVFARLKSTLWS